MDMSISEMSTIQNLKPTYFVSFTLNSGISAFGNAPSAMIPAAALIAVIGGLSGYGFSLIGRVCSYTNANSYSEVPFGRLGPDILCEDRCDGH